jgi:hypothetical protein
MATFAHNLHKRAHARYKEGTARGLLSPSVKPRTGYSGGTLAMTPRSLNLGTSENFSPTHSGNRPFVYPASERRSGTFASAAGLGPLTLSLFLHAL